MTQLLDMATVIAQMDDIDKTDAYSDFCEVLDDVSSSQYYPTVVEPNGLFLRDFTFACKNKKTSKK